MLWFRGPYFKTVNSEHSAAVENSLLNLRLVPSGTDPPCNKTPQSRLLQMEGVMSTALEMVNCYTLWLETFTDESGYISVKLFSFKGKLMCFQKRLFCTFVFEYNLYMNYRLTMGPCLLHIVSSWTFAWWKRFANMLFVYFRIWTVYELQVH